MKCPECGTEIPLEASYCDSCGRSVVEGIQAQAHSPHPGSEDLSPSKKGSRGLKPIWIAGLSLFGVLIVAAAIFGSCSWGNRDRASTIPPT
ncbi:MAG: zinc-ribbon domain-containing protein, partial [Anaerolineales bacterium]